MVRAESTLMKSEMQKSVTYMLRALIIYALHRVLTSIWSLCKQKNDWWNWETTLLNNRQHCRLKSNSIAFVALVRNLWHLINSPAVCSHFIILQHTTNADKPALVSQHSQWFFNSSDEQNLSILISRYLTILDFKIDNISLFGFQRRLIALDWRIFIHYMEICSSLDLKLLYDNWSKCLNCILL